VLAQLLPPTAFAWLPMSETGTVNVRSALQMTPGLRW
jgi:hypothetical protein